MPRVTVLAIATALSIAMVDGASACAVCIGFPEKTAADHVIEGHCVVLARQDDENPFAYAPDEVLKGSFDGMGIDLLVGSRTRRVLQADESCRVLLVQAAPGGGWRNFGVTSPEFEAVVRRILSHSGSWKGEDGSIDRVQFFLQLFGHEERSIRELAYLELGRAPYRFIKRLGQVATREDFAPMLDRHQYLEWRSLAILLLAQSDDPQDKQRILESFYTAHQFGLTTNLAAWTAAAVEVEGESMIDFIEDNCFRRSDREPEQLQAVFAALSMLGAGSKLELQNRIVSSYRILLADAPEFAPRVADDLRRWKRTELTSELSDILADGTRLDVTGKQSIRKYLRAAATSEESARFND